MTVSYLVRRIQKGDISKIGTLVCALSCRYEDIQAADE